MFLDGKELSEKGGAAGDGHGNDHHGNDHHGDGHEEEHQDESPKNKVNTPVSGNQGGQEDPFVNALSEKLKNDGNNTAGGGTANETAPEEMKRTPSQIGELRSRTLSQKKVHGHQADLTGIQNPHTTSHDDHTPDHHDDHGDHGDTGLINSLVALVIAGSVGVFIGLVAWTMEILLQFKIGPTKGMDGYR